MSYSYTLSNTTTFTVTHARHMAAKVAADLKRLERFYGKPSDTDIANYEAEIIALLKAGYLNEVTYGFKRGGLWIEPTLRYSAADLNGDTALDDDPGRVRPGANVSGAAFYSFLSYDSSWFSLSQDERERFRKTLSVVRTTAEEPEVDGYMSPDRTYSAGGRALNRFTVRSY
ncbi:MAG: hypothetical protein RIE53_07290 [Rhodothermales bacterium]